MIEGHEPAADDASHLSGARADFVATLGRRVSALKDALAGLELDRRSLARRDTLMRRLHAMGTAARVLGFEAVAEALSGAERALGRSAPTNEVAVSDLAEVSRALDLLPALAWGGSVAVRAPPSRAEPDGLGPSGPLGVLLFGAGALGDALDEDSDGSPVDTERTEDPSKARELARVLGPDVIIIDADRRGARELVENIVRDPLVDPVPIVVVGTFELPEAASSYVALGAVRVLPKPVSPDTLRRTVLAIARRTRPRIAAEPIGDVTVDELSARIAAELRRGLQDAVEPGGQRVRVPLGEGTDVLAAVWGAVARIREVLVLRSAGTVRFDPSGPEGAVPLAPWTGGDRRSAERESAGRDVEGVVLSGRRAVVVDDDPAVVWFVAGLLKSAGVEVFEAHDGLTALELTLEQRPDVVISDVLMPGLDGLSLCREIKRDVAVRDVPVILLSWKEDLLQRLRELGADADGYLRKEATGAVVMRRVSEVLRSRARVEERLASGGEVRGRLDGLTTRLVLELAAKRQPNCRVSVRDAVYLYEVELRGGQPRCATRTATDGSFERGAKALTGLLGVSAGRFVVSPSSAAVRADLEGSLEDNLREPIRRARAAQRALGSESLMRVDRLDLDPDALAAYLPATPEPASQLIERLLRGEAPRDLIVSGGAPARLLEAVLSDLVRHGAVLRVITSAEPIQVARAELAPVSVEEEQERLFTFDLGAPVETEAIDSAWSDSAPAVSAAPRARVVEVGRSARLPLSRTVTPPIAELDDEPRIGEESRTHPGVGPVVPSSPRIIEQTPDPVSEALLADSVPPTTAISPAQPVEPAPKSEPAPKPEPAPEPEPELETLADSELVPEPEPAAQPPAPVVAPMPPKLSETVRILTPTPPPRAPEPPPKPIAASPAVPESDEVAPMLSAERDEAPAEVSAVALPAQKRIEFPGRRREPASEPPTPSLEPAARNRPKEDTDRPMSLGRVVLVTIAAAAASFGIVRWAVAPDASEGSVATEGEPAVTAPAAVASAPRAAPPPAAEALSAQDLELPAGVPIPPDKGLLELETGGKHALYVDGTFVGLGPRRRVPLDPGKHEVKTRLGGDEKVHSVEVRQGRRTRLAAPGAGP